jgi:hypothetical protein
MQSEDEPLFPDPARGMFVPDDEFTRSGNHLEGWNRAVDDALAKFRRTPGKAYQITVVLSAAVEEEQNPGRITAYIATLV